MGPSAQLVDEEQLDAELEDGGAIDAVVTVGFGDEKALVLLDRARVRAPSARRVLLSDLDGGARILAALSEGRVHRVLESDVSPDALTSAIREMASLVLRPPRTVVVREGSGPDGLADRLREAGAQVERVLHGLPRSVEAELVVLVEPGIELVEAARGALGREGTVVAVLSDDDPERAATLLDAGADDVVWRPVDARAVVRRHRARAARRASAAEVERLRERLATRTPLPGIIGRSEPMQRVFAVIHRVATTDAAVLLLGETGTGKELLAKAVHALSARREGPFVPLNLSALPDTLVESELFGHELGAFTGARSRRIGQLEAVRGGTLFLDEIGDLSLDLQVKLLRILENHQFTRLGSNESLQADFRLVCATHRELEARVAEGLFREDLYYRLNVVRLDVPPLRERGEDVVRLARHFLEKFRRRAGLRQLELGEDAIAALKAHHWPGNVRELEHIIERAVALGRDGEVIGADLMWTRPRRRPFRADLEAFLEGDRGLPEVLADLERRMIVETLQRYDGNQVATARKLKIPRQTLQSRMKKLGL